MRLFVFNCLLLASVTVALPIGRQRRDLPYLKNLITSAIFGQQQMNIQPPVLQTEPEYRLFQLPGYDDIMVKIAPKKPVVEELVYPAVEPVDLNEAPVIETGTPVITEVIEPLEEKVELKVPFEPQYSYKQMEFNEPVMTYTGHNNPDVELVEKIKMKTELPMCIKKRVDEAIVLGADPYRLVPVQEQAVYQYQIPPVLDISYPREEVNSYVQDPFRRDYLTEGPEIVADFGLPPQRFRPLKDSSVTHNVRPTKIQAINPRPLPLYSEKSPHLDQVNITAIKDTSQITSQTGKGDAFTNLGDKVNLSQTLGPIPPQYIKQLPKNELPAESKEKTVGQTTVANIVSTKDNISNVNIPSYVYKYQSNPNTGEVVPGNNALRTNLNTNTNQYIFGPAANSGTPKTVLTQVKEGLYTNKLTARPQSVTDSIGFSTNALKENSLKENKPTPLKDNPIIVPDVKNYSYHQKYADGSHVHVSGGKNGVSVVKVNNFKGRGDIPDQ